MSVDLYKFHKEMRRERHEKMIAAKRERENHYFEMGKSDKSNGVMNDFYLVFCRGDDGVAYRRGWWS